MARTSTRLRTPRRSREWITDSGAIPVTTNAARDVLLGYRTNRGTTTGTVGAVRMSFLHNQTTPTAIAAITVGLVVAPAATAPASINPTAFPDLDWMMLHTYFVHTQGVVGDQTIVENDIYIKSMRKVADLGNTLFISIFSTGTAGTFNFHLRALWLPS